MLEQNQNITKQYAVAYAVLALKEVKPKAPTAFYSDVGKEMVKLMRIYKGKEAIKKANKILN